MTETPSNAMPLPEEIAGPLRAAGLIPADGACVAAPLAGGVSSDIWKVTAGGRTFAVKRALAKLKVAADWRAPVERNAYEVAWFRVAAGLAPGVAPQILLHDPEAGLYAMTYYDAATHRLWKPDLLAGRVDVAAAREVGDRMGAIHDGTAGRADIAAMFPNEGFFFALRLEPYLEATAERYPDLAATLTGLSRRTSETKAAMVHGDISPKNILIGPDGPVFLDAECACISDPAFDVAFCLNHLFLKCTVHPEATPRYMEAAQALSDSWLAIAKFDAADELEGRVATLLPGLTLARIDGKSPVEYITDEPVRERVRAFAREHLAAATPRLATLRDDWTRRWTA